VTNPRVVVVLDPTLVGSVDVAEGVPQDGIIIVNTEKSPADIRKTLGLTGSIKVFTVDASRVSTETIGRDIPNTPMLGALMKATGMLDFKEMLDGTRKKLEKKFKTKPEVVEGNVKAIERAYNEVRS
jgi:pyruvate ferredoxin oxidoreductase gamma subunit